MKTPSRALFATLAWIALSALGSWKASAQPVSTESGIHVNPARMEEWNSWRFGLFIHWGPWSQTQTGSVWNIVNGPPELRDQRFEHGKTFNPTEFNPKKWARTARAAGMKYVVFVVKHHDGFNNYATALSGFKITAPGSPYAKSPHADLTRAVIDAFRAENLAIGLYYSHIDWHHPDGKYYSYRHWDYDESRIDRDPASWQRFVDYEIGQIRELLTDYGKIDILWFDMYWPTAGLGRVPATSRRVRSSTQALLRTVRSLQPDIILNDRGTDVYGDFYTPEGRVPETGLPGNWESCITIVNGPGFWYKGEDVTAKPPEDLVRTLVDVASKGGNFLLNVGPRPDGELTLAEYTALAEVGAWTKIYGDSIYGTTRSLLLDLSFGRSTTKGRTLYLHVFDWPKDGKLVVPGLLSPVRKAWRIADLARNPLPVTALGEDKIIAVGANADPALVSVIALELATDPEVRNAVRQKSDGTVELNAARAHIEGSSVQYNSGLGNLHGNFIEGLQNIADRAIWNLAITQAGDYRVTAEYAVQTPQAGSSFSVTIDGQPLLTASTRATADWNGPLLRARRIAGTKVDANDKRWPFQKIDLGTVYLAKPGTHTLAITPRTIAKDYLFFLRSVTLTPIEQR